MTEQSPLLRSSMTWTITGILVGAGGGTLIGSWAGNSIAGIGIGIALGAIAGFLTGMLLKR